MTGQFAAVLARYGQEMTVTHGGVSAAVRAFLQPLEEKGQETVSPLGTADERRFLWLGQDAIAIGDLVGWQGLSLAAEDVTEYWVGRELSHRQAVLRVEREAAR
ncbi:MAG: hypothetical protein RRY95_01355 [Oscillospiraceae bacterium]